MAIHHGIKYASKPKLRKEENYKEIEALLNNGDPEQSKYTQSNNLKIQTNKVHEGTKPIHEDVKPKSAHRAIESDEESIELEDPYCGKCDLIFDSNLELEEHEVAKHGEGVKPKNAPRAMRLSPPRENKSEEEEHIKCQYCGKNLETYVWLLKPYQIKLCQKCTQKLSPLVFIENSKEMDEFIKHDKVRNQK